MDSTEADMLRVFDWAESGGGLGGEAGEALTPPCFAGVDGAGLADFADVVAKAAEIGDAGCLGCGDAGAAAPFPGAGDFAFVGDFGFGG